MREIVISVDLGGTKTAAALVDAAGNLVSEKVRVPTPGQQGGEAMLDAMAVAISQQYAQLGGDRLVGIGVGTAGAVDTERGARCGTGRDACDATRGRGTRRAGRQDQCGHPAR